MKGGVTMKKLYNIFGVASVIASFLVFTTAGGMCGKKMYKWWTED